MNKIKMKIQNRLFQKGDTVRFINQGRILSPPFDYDKTYTVTQKETETGVVSVDNIDFSSSWLELVEPVEKNYPLVFHEVCPDCQPIVDKCLIEFEKAFPDEDEDA